MIIASCDVNEKDQTIDGIKFTNDEFVRRFMRLLSIEVTEYDYKKDNLYDGKNKVD